MFIILTSKDGQFCTEHDDGIVPLERYDYYAHGARRAQFTIARLVRETRVKIINADEPSVVNYVRTKFLEKYADESAARHALEVLTRFGTRNTELRKLS